MYLISEMGKKKVKKQLKKKKKKVGKEAQYFTKIFKFSEIKLKILWKA